MRVLVSAFVVTLVVREASEKVQMARRRRDVEVMADFRRASGTALHRTCTVSRLQLSRLLVVRGDFEVLPCGCASDQYSVPKRVEVH